jgi:hypothetical protein
MKKKITIEILISFQENINNPRFFIKSIPEFLISKAERSIVRFHKYNNLRKFM